MIDRKAESPPWVVQEAELRSVGLRWDLNLHPIR